MNAPAVTLAHEELSRFCDAKYSRKGEPGWGPTLRRSFNYFSPDDFYEALVAKLIGPATQWADVGCGRDVFPSYPELARELADRCKFLFGIEPDPNIKDNPFIHDGFHGVIEDCDTERRFDLITLRMVAEHIVNADRAVAKFAQLCAPGGQVVVYTPYRWSPMSLAAAALPFSLHHPLKRLIWDAESRDTFPTAYNLNTRADLSKHFNRHGFVETYFHRLDDCRIFGRYRYLNCIELAVRAGLHAMRVPHPEACLLAVFRKTG